MRYRNQWMDARIGRVRDVASRVREIEIVVEEAIPYTPGAHLDFLIPVNDQPEIRSYSLIGDYSSSAPYAIAVKKLPKSKGGSAYMWTLEPGNQIRISQPMNHFELSFETDQYLLVAGGIGITPLIGMAEVLVRRPDISVQLLYLGTALEEMPYIDRLQKLLGDQLECHYSDVSGFYDFNTLLNSISKKTRVYLCGPLPMMNAFRKTWDQSSFDNHHLRFETFGASGRFAPQEFKVHIPRFDTELSVGENETVLHALERMGIPMMADCKKGECGLCLVDILEFTGDIDHRDYFLSEDQKGENKKFCSCVSRVANGALTIDIPYRGVAINQDETKGMNVL